MKRLQKFYERMYLIRHFEVTMENLFQKGLLFGTIHGCIGQEAVAVGVISAISSGDIITGHHRSHGHFLAYTDDIEGLMAEIMGKACGIVGGRGGSQHLQKRDFYTNGVQGSMVSVATGMALAEKIKKTGNIIVCFMGDGTMGQGVIYESINMASLWNLPILYVIENNLYAMSTRVEDGVAGSIVDRGGAFGIESSEITSNDVEIIYEQAAQIVNKVRKNSKPYFLVLNTYRLCGHSKSDDRCYRSKEEEAEWANRDPLLITGPKIPDNLRKAIEQICRKRIEQAFEKIKNANFPPKEVLCESPYGGFER